MDDTSPFLLFNEIQRIFDYYEKWDTRLYELANQEGSIQEMLDESFRGVPEASVGSILS